MIENILFIVLIIYFFLKSIFILKSAKMFIGFCTYMKDIDDNEEFQDYLKAKKYPQDNAEVNN
jgi:hypothetical protein